MNPSRNVGILVFPGVEVLDFSGPFEVFSVASRVFRRDRDPRVTPFEAFFIAETSQLVSARYGFGLQPHFSFAQHPHVDILVVPGGIVDQPRASAGVLDWIRRTAHAAELVTSVCTGAFLLADIGLLNGLQATTHWEDTADLRKQFPRVEVLEDKKWVDQGRVVTSAGIAAGIDMTLHLVSRLHDDKLAHSVARQMVYEWRGE